MQLQQLAQVVSGLTHSMGLGLTGVLYVFLCKFLCYSCRRLLLWDLLAGVCDLIMVFFYRHSQSFGHCGVWGFFFFYPGEDFWGAAPGRGWEGTSACPSCELFTAQLWVEKRSALGFMSAAFWWIADINTDCLSVCYGENQDICRAESEICKICKPPVGHLKPGGLFSYGLCLGV